jgi:predicted ATP-dependent endonuclease of OLD family
MSQANAAARKRRAGGATLQDNGVPAQTNNISQQQSPKGGLTLPQVISLVDKRLITLETFMKETQSGGSQTNGPSSAATTSASEDAVNSMADEFDTKFAVLAQEVADLKDIVLKLQTYTMEVNKTLYEERIHVLSDMGQPKDERIDFHISDDEVEEVGEP